MVMNTYTSCRLWHDVLW